MKVKYLLGECEPEERATVEDWINASPENRKEFSRMEILWQESRLIHRESTVDIEAAWNRFRQLRDNKETKAQETKVVSINRPGLLKMVAAAALIIVLGITLLFRIIGNKNESIPAQITQLQIQTLDSVRTDTLPDGTLVTLNKNSSIFYPASFSDSIREVSMNGEVFFDVTKNPAKPFIIHTKSADIKVLGTSFNIKTNDDKTEVIVESGRVEVSNRNAKAELTPGKKVLVQPGDTVLQVENNQNKLYQHYRSRMFDCDNTRLSDLAATLQEVFGANIVFDSPSTANMRITTTFSNESLENILTIIEQTMGVKAIRQGDTITIYSNSK